MPQYIDRDKLKTRFGNEMLRVKIKDNDDAENVLSDVVDSMPTADVQPVRRGEWIEREDGTYCSNCGKKPIPDIDYDAFWQPDYCPNCGSYNREE